MIDPLLIALPAAGVLVGAMLTFLATSGRLRRAERDAAAFAAQSQHAQARIAELDAAAARSLENFDRERSALNAQIAVLHGERQHLAATLDARRSETDKLSQLLDAELAQKSQRQEDVARLRAREAQLSAELQARSEELARQKQWFEEQSQALRAQMELTAQKLLDEKSRAFTEVNRREIDAIIAPFKEQLGEFRRRVDTVFQTDTQDRAALKEQIQHLTALNQTVSKQTLDLTQALTVTSKAAGNWGEMILRKLLEDSGLREGHEYRLQLRIASEAGDAQQPDAVVFLPEGRQIVIDAKVSNKAWTEYCAATNPEQRERHFAEHLKSLRAHIRGLAERDYSQSPDLRTVDFVLMFVPVEGALLEALAKEEAIYSEAYSRKIIPVVPTTLLAVIKLVEGMWHVQRRQENAEHIAEAGRKLYDKLVNFVGSVEEIGRGITATQKSYERAIAQLAHGPGNAIRLAEQMRALGVKPSKNKKLPDTLTGFALDEEAGDESQG